METPELVEAINTAPEKVETIVDLVHKILFDSLFKNEEYGDFRVVYGITRHFGFHPVRLESHREEIRSILKKMPRQFHVENGGGWSFLNLTNDYLHNEWGKPIHAEILLALAMGLGMTKFNFPREMWSTFAGGSPLITLNTNGEPYKTTSEEIY